jgi:hypothetical protein
VNDEQRLELAARADRGDTHALEQLRDDPETASHYAEWYQRQPRDPGLKRQRGPGFRVVSVRLVDPFPRYVRELAGWERTAA